jgi:cellobiose epimerase
MTDGQIQTDVLLQWKAELTAELNRIMSYWINNTPDDINDGFVGRIASNGRIDNDAPKGSVLNARILWSFSAAYNFCKKPEYLKYAERAYQYITDYFIDKMHGGVFWTVDPKGMPLNTKKQVYAIAFTIYGLSEFYLASGNENAKLLAISLYSLLVDKSFDRERTGYFEAFSQDWQPANDLRLSEKDENEIKTTNTHLHVLEAYSNLYRIWPVDELKKQISLLINNFLDHFIDHSTGHLLLFFDENWYSKSALVSYGHDIEATWLLQKAAEQIQDDLLLKKIKSINLKVAEAAMEGLDTDGGLWYEYQPAENNLIREKHWWVQAEAMIGFFNAWQIDKDEKFSGAALKNWDFIQKNILDTENGEWLWGINENGKPMPGEDRVGLWKCPYHNTRACIELIKRLSESHI